MNAYISMRTALAAVAVGCIIAASAQELLFEPGPGQGANPLPVSLNRWRSETVSVTAKPTEKDYVDVHALDFFRLEYGRAFAPTNFSTVGAKEWRVDFPDTRFGRGWAADELGRFTIVMEIDQDVPETKWRLLRASTGGRNAHDFTVKGKGPQRFRKTLGMIHGLVERNNLSLLCSTPDAKVSIKSLEIVPTRLPVSWRRTFVLDALPARAGLSTPWKDVTVNGRSVWKTRPIGSQSVFRHDLVPFLRVGTNEVVVSADYNSGYCPPPLNLSYTEAFCVTRAGKLVRLGADGSWEWRYGDGAWARVTGGCANGVERIASGMEVAHRGGRLPLHAGALVAEPSTADGYPLFDAGAVQRWTLSVPAGVTSPVFSLAVTNTLTGRAVEPAPKLALAARPAAKGASLAYWDATLAALPVGAYEITWKLAAADGVADAYRCESVALGRLAQDEFACADFEKALDRRLELLADIDCTAAPEEDAFLDHSAGRTSQSALDVGCVTNVGPFLCRLTGPKVGDFFSYRIPVGKLGDAHIVEIEFPDVDERILCTSVQETFPNDFCYNNLPGGVRAWPNATGSVRTGGVIAPTGKLRKMRTVFFPGSKNVTYTVENQQSGAGAPVCRIRVYHVKGGLPALKLPKTERVYANHCERPLYAPWGTFVTPVATDYTRGAFERCWAAGFAAAANRLAFMRYAGQNAAVEGVYMYHEIFGTLSGESSVTATDYDLAWLFARLAAKNDIRVFPCFEYMKSPKIRFEKAHDTSDREIIAGTARGLYNVDGEGHQSVGYMTGGLNYLAPPVWNSITNLLAEIYAKWSALPNVEGLFTVNGYWWLPGITITGGRHSEDIGFDDDTYELFVRETGRDLGPKAAKGPGRFAVRKSVLNGELKEAWGAWRAKKIRDALEGLSRVVRGGAHDWKVFSVPQETYPPVTPFNRIGATKAERDGYQVARLKVGAFDPALFTGRGTGAVNLVPEINYDWNHRIGRYGAMLSEGSKRLYAHTDAVYFAPIGLNEHFGLNASGKKRWWWRWVPVTVYDVKPAGAAAFYDFVDVLSSHSPLLMFHTWLDVNLTTGHADIARRFAAGFLSTPAVPLAPAPRVTGVSAFFGKGVLQLVNATPYPVYGSLRYSGRVTDALTGRAASNTYRMPPWSVTALLGERADETAGAFAFGARDAAIVRAGTDRVLDTPLLAAAIDAGVLAKLADARARNDAYAQARLQRDVEILEPVSRFASAEKGTVLQRRLEEMLKKDGVARIDCGSTKDTVDELGRTWLADQKYTGFGTWGNQYGRDVDRGQIDIAGTKIPSVYRTECGAIDLLYNIPLPEGAYDVVLHFAETWDKTPGREMYCTVGGERRFVDVWGKAGGRCAAMQETWKGVKPVKGEVAIVFERNSIVNGIEIFRK